MYLRLSGVAIFFGAIFVSLTCLGQVPLREDLKKIGGEFRKSMEGKTKSWITGGDAIPSFISDFGEQINSVTINTKTPNQLKLNELYQQDPSILRDFRRMEWISGLDYQKRNEFLDRLSMEVVSGNMSEEYNYFIKESRRLGCWRTDTPYKNECDRQKDIGLGILFALYVNQSVLASTEVPIDRMLKALGKFLVGENFSPSMEVGILAINFSTDPDPSTLVNLGYRINDSSAVFKNFSSGELNEYDIDRLKKIEEGTYRNNFISQFRNSVDTMQVILNDRRRGWKLSAQTAGRIEALKIPLIEIVRHQKDPKFSVKEFYSGLGVLHQYYEFQAEFISLDKLRSFRGDLRAEFKDLTGSFWERFFLMAWGYLSGYGTSITGLTITLLILILGLLGLCFISQNIADGDSRILKSFETYLRILTIRGERTDLWHQQWLVLLIEGFIFIFIPTYLGFMITFLLRSS